MACQNAPIPPPITFAHRGARLDEPENTIAAFRRALELGARGLESDAWLSSDGEVVLVHDRTFRRGLRRIHVERTTAARLRDFDVPRLADLYDELGRDFELSLDVKARAAGEAILAVARERGDPARLWLCSSSTKYLIGLREKADAGELLVHSRGKRHLQGAVERHAADLAEAGIDAMNFHRSDWSTGLVSLFHRFDVRTLAWDAQETRHLRSMLEYGVDGLYCDNVARMVAVVDEWTTGDPAD
jgi:glycerophosphoryl diester phosphodiesterase